MPPAELQGDEQVKAAALIGGLKLSEKVYQCAATRRPLCVRMGESMPAQ